MSASRRANATRGGDGRTNPDSELVHHAIVQESVVDLLRLCLLPNFTGKAVLCLHFKDSALVKVQTTYSRDGLGKFGEADLKQHSQLVNDLQKHAKKLLEWGTKDEGLWGEATLEMLFSRGKFTKPLTHLTKDKLIRDKKMAA